MNTFKSSASLFTVGLVFCLFPAVLSGNKRVQGRSIDIGCFESSMRGFSLIMR